MMRFRPLRRKKIEGGLFFEKNMKSIEVELDNGKKVLLTFIEEIGYSKTLVRCFRVGEINKRQHLLDIIEGCQKELEVIYEHNEH
jgi:hypothetical protein